MDKVQLEDRVSKAESQFDKAKVYLDLFAAGETLTQSQLADGVNLCMRNNLYVGAGKMLEAIDPKGLILEEPGYGRRITESDHANRNWLEIHDNILTPQDCYLLGAEYYLQNGRPEIALSIVTENHQSVGRDNVLAWIQRLGLHP